MTATCKDTPQATCVDHGQRGNRDGYGHSHGKLLHRLVYSRHNNVPLESMAGQSVRHTCDNPRCVNPDHLLLGSHYDNMRDKVVRGRSQMPKLRHLNSEQVAQIRQQYKPGGKAAGTHSPTGQRALARAYGVPQSVIRQIVLNLTYKETQ